MKTYFNIACILIGGLIAGYVWRTSRTGADAIPDNETVYTTDGLKKQDGQLLVDTASEPQPSEPARPPEDEKWASDFQLTDQNNQPLSSDDLLGTPYLVSFFFSTCPSICVQQNQKLAELQEQFSADELRFAAISVDPETDTPERLREYAARFGADANQWSFLTGDLTYIRNIGEEVYDQPVDKQFHTERFILVDPEGNIEGFYNWPDRLHLKKMTNKVRQMNERSS